MNNIFKTYRFALILGAFMLLGQVRAQVSTCAILYDIDVTSEDMDAMTKAMMEDATMELAFMGQKSRVKMDMQMMASTAVMDMEAKKGVVLMDMMGMKIASPMEDEAFNEDKDPMENYEFERTGKTKKIAGYLCEKVVIKGEDGSVVETWYTDKIQPETQTSYNYSKIKGFPLEMEVNQDGMQMHFIATKVMLDGLTEGDFSTEVPAGYREMTPEQIQQMGGGR